MAFSWAGRWTSNAAPGRRTHRYAPAVPALEPASIGSLYERAIVDTGRQPEFLFFVAFLVSFGFIRTSAHMIRAQVSWWPGNVQVGGTHIHHLVWGILLLLVTGWAMIALDPGSPWQEIIAILFGIGTGLTLDEFALWLNLKDVYWSEKGRRSIDAVIVAATITGMVLVGFSAWIDVATKVEEGVFAIVGFAGLLGIGGALVNLLKEKFGMALLSLVIPMVGVVGALRLARPTSPWARLYGERRLERSRKRFRGREESLPGWMRPARGPSNQSAAGSGATEPGTG
jgi:hypothetical protein